MKTLPAFAIPLLFSLSLLGCGKKTDDPQAKTVDPFLGHWVSSSMHDVDLSANGAVSHDNTYQHTYMLDADATTFTESQFDGTLSTDPPKTYTRAGAVLTVAGAGAGWAYEARNLTDTGFTYVVTHPRTGGGSNVQTIVYRR